MRPDRGKVLGGRYRLEDRIAVGGMGEVWRGTDDVLGRTVAVKVLKEEYASDADFLERFRAEARHSAVLTHPNVAGVYDYGEADSSPYLVMELVPGEPLSDTLAREGAMDVAAIMPVLGQAAQGLAAAHAAGVVHRDVKPGNLLLTPDGRVKITDFGIARAGDQAPLTRTGQVMGTAQYLAPEQAMGRPATPAGDLYALGVVAYEALAGRRPFEADSQVALAMAHVNETPPALPASVPYAARELVARAMAKDPQDRPADASTFAAVAHALARGDDAAALDLLGPAPGAGTATAAMPTAAGPGTAATQAMTGAGAGAAGAALGAAEHRAAAAEQTSAGTAATVTPGPVGRPRRRLTGPLVALLALVAFVLAGALLARPLLGGEAAPTPSDTATTAPAPTTSAVGTEPPQQTETPSEPPAETLTLDPADYVGRDREAVGAELEALGLRVREQGDPSSEEAAGTVLSLSPTEGLAVGDVVTLVYADPPAPTQTPDTSTPTTATDTSTQGSGSSGNSGSGNQGSGNPGGAAPTQGAAPAVPGVGAPGGPGVGTGVGGGPVDPGPDEVPGADGDGG